MTEDAVPIQFAGSVFAWHPARAPVDERFGPERDGPMLVVRSEDEETSRLEALRVAEELLSALAFKFDVPIEDSMLGTGTGGDDIFNPSGARVTHGSIGGWGGFFLSDAPHGIVVIDDPALRRALGLYREGLNAASPFYRCLAYRGVLDIVFGVTNETRGGQVTPEAARRDAYIDAQGPAFALQLSGSPPAPPSWAEYLREDVRNAVSHVLRAGRREVDADDPADRWRLDFDSGVLKRLARHAIEDRWSFFAVTTAD
jgi:hypothetical protein